MTAQTQSTAPQTGTEDTTERQLGYAHDKLARAREQIGSVIYGQDSVIDNTLITMLAGGHVLLIGVPGLAKTLLVDTIGKVLDLSTSRIQCTPDLMPADVIGSEVLEEHQGGRRDFRFIKGPVFTQFLMADEINRASPRTQSALLQAMQEGYVTIAGQSYDLPKPFHVLATQNPIEQEGTYPLPEAQLDRFLMQVDVDYPDEAAERKMLAQTTTNAAITPRPVFVDQDLGDFQALVRDMPVGETVIDAIVKLVRLGRPGENAPQLVNDYVVWAPGPRCSQALMLAVRARALLQGRAAPSVEDVTALAVPVMKHRMALNFRAQSAGVTIPGIINTLCEDL